jgi:hypothetical protein
VTVSRNAIRHAAILSSILIASLGLIVSAAQDEPRRLVPKPDEPGADTLVGSTWVSEDEGYALRLQRIDAAQRLAYIEHMTGLTTDPFASKPGQPPRYLSFVLEIQNRGDQPLQFDPRKCWLITGKKEIQSPLEMTDLSFQYRTIGQELPPAYARAGSALFGHIVDLRAGESQAGLLVFRAVPAKTRRYSVDAQIVLANGSVAKITGFYAREKKDKKQQDGDAGGTRKE